MNRQEIEKAQNDPGKKESRAKQMEQEIQKKVNPLYGMLHGGKVQPVVMKGGGDVSQKVNELAQSIGDKWASITGQKKSARGRASDEANRANNPGNNQGRTYRGTVEPDENKQKHTPQKLGAGGIATGTGGVATGGMNAYTNARSADIQRRQQELAEKNAPIQNAIGIMNGIGSIAGGVGSAVGAFMAEGGPVSPETEVDLDESLIQQMATSSVEGIEDPTERGLVMTIQELCKAVLELREVATQTMSLISGGDNANQPTG